MEDVFWSGVSLSVLAVLIGLLVLMIAEDVRAIHGRADERARPVATGRRPLSLRS